MGARAREGMTDERNRQDKAVGREMGVERLLLCVCSNKQDKRVSAEKMPAHTTQHNTREEERERETEGRR